MPILTFLGSLLLVVPLIPAFLARRLGRSFAWWFIIGCVLPIVAVFILLGLPDLSELKKIERSSRENRSI
jgi:hypothetical protein